MALGGTLGRALGGALGGAGAWLAALQGARRRRGRSAAAQSATGGGVGVGLAFRPSAPSRARRRPRRPLGAARTASIGARDLAPDLARRRAGRYESAARGALQIGRSRMIAAAAAMTLAFAVVGLRLAGLSLFGDVEPTPVVVAAEPGPRRGAIVDRAGALLAATLPSASLFADARNVLDPARTALALATVLPDLDQAAVAQRLARDRAFVWLRRDLSPRQQAEVNRLGLPGLGFQTESRRVYPQGAATAHTVGYVNIDGDGLAGVERRWSDDLGRGDDLALSIDVRAQFAVRAAVGEAVQRHQARAGVGLLMDVATGELVALVSIPEFDPGDPGAARPAARFNNATLGVFEMGSTFKIFTAAIALETRVVDLNGGYDATDPIRAYGYTITDFHPRARWLSVPEIFKYSSNIGSAKMALDVGVDAQRAWMDALGLTTPAALELAEVGRPLVPDPWRPINMMTIAYGHGLSVSPVQLAAAVAAVVNGGIYRRATLVKQNGPVAGRRVFSQDTSDDMRRLMRLSVVEGTGRKADAAGYFVGGKTGSAEKIVDGAYDQDRLVSSFIGAFPMDAPRYIVFAMLDEPVGTPDTQGNATGGWVAAPIARAIVEAAAPILGVEPRLGGDAAVVRALAIDAGGPPLEETAHAPR